MNRMTEMEYEDLARLILGVPDDYEDPDLDGLMYAKLGVEMGDFMVVANALLPYTISGMLHKLSDNSSTEHRGYVHGGSFIVKETVGEC